MKIFIIIDETPFFHPSFLNDLLIKIKEDVVGVGLVTKIPKKSSLKKYLIKNFYFLRFSEIIKLIIYSINYKLIGLINIFKNTKSFSCVKSVLVSHKIPFFNIEKNINQEKYLSRIKNLSPDIIISSNSLIFKKEILSIPKICSINRHSSLLPLYGGLWPIFHAFINNEKTVGVSAHIMNNKIDTGCVLYKKEVLIEKNDTIFTLYKKCFDISAEVIIESLKKVENIHIHNNDEVQYFSFPTHNDWKVFRNQKGKFI